MVEERIENIEEPEEISEESSDDNREEETRDEIRDEIYVNDDEIEMLRKIEERLDSFEGKLSSIFDTVSMFVDSGMVIREANPLDEGDITEGEDFASDYMSIDELDFSLD